MAILKPIIPFGLLPFSWGMKGKTRDIAQAEYYLTDYELEMSLNNINLEGDDLLLANIESNFKWKKITHIQYDLQKAALYPDPTKLLEVSLLHDKITQKEYDLGMADLSGDTLKILEAKFKHGVIAEKEHDYGVATLRNDEGTWLGVKHKHGELSDNDFLKQMATLRGEAWVNYIEIDVSKGVTDGAFKLDWNDKFIEEIRAEGFVGRTDDDCVDLWLTNVSKNIALAELTGTGIFDEQAEKAYELKKKRLKGGKTEYK